MIFWKTSNFFNFKFKLFVFSILKAEYLTCIGDKEAATEAIRKTMDKTVGLGNRMDLIFLNIRLGLFYMDHAFITSNLHVKRR